jgi:hypothetical protein
VAQQDVTELVRHDAGHLAFGGGRVEHAAVDEHRPAGEREGVDVLEVDGGERILERVVLEVGGRGRHQSPAQAVEVGIDLAVVDDGVLAPHLGGGFLTDLDVLLRRILVLGRGDASLRTHHGRAQEKRCHSDPNPLRPITTPRQGLCGHVGFPRTNCTARC